MVGRKAMTYIRVHSNFMKQQRLLAAICLAAMALLYLIGGGYWAQLTAQSHRYPTSAGLARLAPPFVPAKLEFMPDVAPPVVHEGVAPDVYRIETSQPVVFLTIDDGFHREPEAATRMRRAGIPATLFLTQQYVAQSPDYFRQLADQTESTIQNHTLTHKDLASAQYDEQRHEICATSDDYARVYGRRSTLFRPPYGNYNHDTQRAAADCGMHSVVMWSALVEHGAMHYQIGDKLRAGDIVLMHFTPSFAADLEAFAAASRDAGLQPQLLDDWLVGSTHKP